LRIRAKNVKEDGNFLGLAHDHIGRRSVDIHKMDEDLYLCSFVPQHIGNYILEIYLNGKNVYGSPVVIIANPSPNKDIESQLYKTPTDTRTRVRRTTNVARSPIRSKSPLDKPKPDFKPVRTLSDSGSPDKKRIF